MPIRVVARRNAPQVPRRAPAAVPPFGLPIPPADWPQRPAGISLCMIVKNEERFLERCLASVAGAVDEINIVDTGSTDRTMEIARRFGARIEQRGWRNDFAWARNESLAMATKRWIFQLDADEELLEESVALLHRLREAPAHLTGLWIRCLNASDKYRGAGGVSHAIVRIFPNHERIRFRGAIHEFPSLDGAALGLQGPNSPIKILHHGYLDEIVGHRDKYARNMEIIDAALAKEPEEAFHWYNAGMTAHLGGDQERAIAGFTRMWELCRANGMRAFTPNGLQTLADVYTERMHDPAKGLEYAMEALKLAPHYANAHFSAGKAYMEMKAYDKAREFYAYAIEDAEFVAQQFVVDDEVPVWKAQCEIGSSYAAQGDDESALEWFDRGIANRPKVQPLRLNRAAALERLGRYADAEDAFRNVYADFKDEQSALQLLNFLLRRHLEHEAVAFVSEAHASMPGPVAAGMLMAAAAVHQKNGWSDGEAYLLKAREAAPDAQDVRHALESLERNRGASALRVREAHAAIAAGDFEAALQVAREGIEADSNDGRIAYYAALASANLGRKEEALTYLRAIRPEEGGESAALLEAVTLRELGRVPEALAAADRALARNAANADAVLVRSGLLETLGRAQEAEATLRAALACGGRRIAVELAALCLRLGRADEAKRVAEEALA